MFNEVKERGLAEGEGLEPGRTLRPETVPFSRAFAWLTSALEWVSRLPVSVIRSDGPSRIVACAVG
jgi:hypothetical protein